MKLRSIRAQVLGLLALSVFSVLLIAALVMSRQTLEPGSAMLAHLIVSQLDALQPQASATLAADSAAQPRRSSSPPSDDRPDTPLAQAVVARLRAEFGDPARVRFEAGDPPRVWVRAADPRAPWFGIAVEPLRRPVARASFLILLLSSLLVLVAGSWLARRLTLPLERLAQSADAVVGGELDASAVAASASSEIVALGASLSRAAQRLREAQRQREETLAGISHDLRTPLARLRFALELGDGQQPAALAAMIGDIEEMDALIGEFLGLTRDGQSGPPQSIDVGALCRSLVAAFRPQIAIDLQLLVPAPSLTGHPLAIRRALGNLLQNALRHGRPPIELRVENSSDGLLFTVNDHGAGLAAQGQADTRGYGLGLSVVRAVAQWHRGSVSLSARPQGGLSVQLLLRDAW